MSPNVEEILKDYDITPLQIIKLDTSGNLAFHIKAKNNQYVLRISPDDPYKSRTREEILSEIELHDYLVKNRFPVAKIIPQLSGNKLVTMGNQCGFLREFIDGNPKQTPNLSEIDKVGQLFGRFHVLTQNFKSNNKRLHIWDLAETKKNFYEDREAILNSDAEKRVEYVRVFEDQINHMEFPEALPSGALHEDLGKRHVLWQKDIIVGVLDLDRFYFGKLILDLGQAVRGWCFDDNGKEIFWNSEAFHVLIKAYQKVRPLEKIEKACLVDAIKFAFMERSLSFMLRYIWGEKTPQSREALADSVYYLFSVLNDVEKSKFDIMRALD